MFLTIVVSALTTVAVFFGLRAVEQRGLLGAPNTTVTVPEVVGMSVDQAREVLKGRGLLLGLNKQRSDARVPAGSIAEQAPLPGSQANNGDTIGAVVSTGAIVVPTTEGLTAEGAKSKLIEAGLSTGDAIATPHASLPAGLVIGSRPAAGLNLAPGTSVQVLVSTGPAGKEVPKVVGQRITRAKKIIEDAGFVVGSTRWGYSDYQDGSVVLKQSPETGAQAEPGSKIDLVVNEPE